MSDKNTAPRKQGAERLQGSRGARLISVIEVRVCVGSGTEENPKRIITEFWSIDGKLLAVNDPQVVSIG